MLRFIKPHNQIHESIGVYPMQDHSGWHPWIKSCYFILNGFANSTILLYSKIYSIHYNELLERTITHEEWLTGKDWNYDLYIDGQPHDDQTEYCITLVSDTKISDDPIFKNSIYWIDTMITGYYFNKSNGGEHFVRPAIAQPNSSNMYIIDGLLYITNYAKQILDIFDGRGPFIHSGVLHKIECNTFELKKNFKSNKHNIFSSNLYKNNIKGGYIYA